MSVSPQQPRFPSLNAMRAFEASARLGGFAQAAEELGVTPGAVAAQIKALEEEIGAALFQRQARGVSLTALGQRALPGFALAFDALAQAANDMRRDAAPRKVHIAALPALAQLWLGPRLPALRAQLADAEISVTAMETPPNLKRVPYDLCLFYAKHPPDGGIRLVDDALLPVCTPALARTLKQPADLKNAVCLVDTAWALDWKRWSWAAMPGQQFAPNGPEFSLYAIALQEALEGAGVLMAHRSLVDRYLRTGELVAPFDISLELEQSICLWKLPGGRETGLIGQVADALKSIRP